MIELLISVGVYSFLAMCLFVLTRDGTRSWRSVDARASVQGSMRIAERDIYTEVKRASYSSVVINKSGTYQHGILFKSAMNDVDDPTRLGDTSLFWVNYSNIPPAPRWQRYVMYYVTRPDQTEHQNTYGFTCASPSGANDDICPHKWLVRKDLYLSASPSDSSGVFQAPYVEGVGMEPTLTGLFGSQRSASNSGSAVARVRILARDILSFNLGVFAGDGLTPVPTNTDGTLSIARPCIIEFDIKAFKVLEAVQTITVGSAPLVTYNGSETPAQGASYQTATAPYTIQFDNRVTPQNP